MKSKRLRVANESMKVKRRRTRRANESFGSQEYLRQEERSIIIQDRIDNDLPVIVDIMAGYTELDWIDASTLSDTNGVYTFDGMIQGSVSRFEVKESRTGMVVKVDGVAYLERRRR